MCFLSASGRITDMTVDEICRKAEDLARIYNPEGLVPFPFENIQRSRDDLRMLKTHQLPDTVSGMIGYFHEDNSSGFSILINRNKPEISQPFTIAHELGHYFLHQDQIKLSNIVDDENVLDRTIAVFKGNNLSQASEQMEMEANYFAASLLMPTELTQKAWLKLRSVDACANLFKVPIEAVGVRLSRLGLII